MELKLSLPTYPPVPQFVVETRPKQVQEWLKALPLANTQEACRKLADAIAAVDDATAGYPAYYMVNCAHPTHFEGALDDAAPWTTRIGGLRANASCLSHAELDVMTELDIGDPADLAVRHRALVDRFPHIKVLGGCCGTDLRHVTAIAEMCVPGR